MTSAWEAVLDDLERQVARAEQLVGSVETETEDVPDWAPPAGLGPLPHPLAARAQDLLDRQQAVLHRIPELLVATRQQLQVGQRIGRATTRPTAPVYLDVTA